MTTKQRQRALGKRLVVLAKCPIPKDISKATSKRPQYSIRDKKEISKYVIKHDLSHKEVGLATHFAVSEQQIRAWKNDYLDGRYVPKLSVSVSRT